MLPEQLGVHGTRRGGRRWQRQAGLARLHARRYCSLGWSWWCWWWGPSHWQPDRGAAPGGDAEAVGEACAQPRLRCGCRGALAQQPVSERHRHPSPTGECTARRGEAAAGSHRVDGVEGADGGL
jgi:hypothetical protein